MINGDASVVDVRTTVLYDVAVALVVDVYLGTALSTSVYSVGHVVFSFCCFSFLRPSLLVVRMAPAMKTMPMSGSMVN